MKVKVTLTLEYEAFESCYGDGDFTPEKVGEIEQANVDYNPVGFFQDMIDEEDCVLTSKTEVIENE